jgi:hypothetical protein
MHQPIVRRTSVGTFHAQTLFRMPGAQTTCIKALPADRPEERFVCRTCAVRSRARTISIKASRTDNLQERVASRPSVECLACRQSAGMSRAQTMSRNRLHTIICRNLLV